MTFYLFFPDPNQLPSLEIFTFEHEDVWVAIGGDYEDLLRSPRYDRFNFIGLSKDGPGPRWLALPRVWRIYKPTSAISPDNPVAIFFWKPDLMELRYENGQGQVEPGRAQDLLNRVLAFDQICEALRQSAPDALFVRDGIPIEPSQYNFSRILRRDRPGRIIDIVHDFVAAALDRVSMVAWWTLNFKGWEAALNENQVEMIRSCAFESRPKAGCLLNLIVDYPSANFETWIKHKVPIYYLFTEAMYYDKRFTRVRPEVMTAYWEACKNANSPNEAEETTMTYFKKERPAVLEFDDFFQQAAMRDLLDNTPTFSYDPGALYHMQAFQSWKPYSSRLPAFATRLLATYETLMHPDHEWDVRIARWAPRTPWKEDRGQRGYTIHVGDEEDPASRRFTGKSFDRETGWIENNVFVLRELLKPAFAPWMGEVFSIEGKRIRPSFTSPEGLQAYEREIVSRALLDGAQRPEDYASFHDWEVGWDDDFNLSTGVVPTTASEPSNQGEGSGNEAEDQEMGNMDPSEEEEEYATAPANRLPLRARLTDPATGQPLFQEEPRDGGLLARLSSPDAAPEGSTSFRGRRNYAERAAVVSGGYSTSTVSRSTDGRSASPVRAAGPVDPESASERLYSPDSARWKTLEADWLGILRELGRYLVSQRGSRVSNSVRRPRLGWATDFVQRGYMQVLSFEDRLRIFLYLLIHRSLRSPVDFLDYVLEMGIKITFWMPRDPIPTTIEAGTENEPSDNESLTLAGKKAHEIFPAWLSALKSPLWAKTHFAAFIQQGSTINYVTRHFASNLLSYAAQGVSWESRTHTRHCMRLPARMGGAFIVRDNLGRDEIGVALGMTPNPENEQNPYYVVPPPATFRSKEWKIGTGEWSRHQEKLVQETIDDV